MSALEEFLKLLLVFSGLEFVVDFDVPLALGWKGTLGEWRRLETLQVRLELGLSTCREALSKQSGGGDQEPRRHFARDGADVLLPSCTSSSSCSWFHNRGFLVSTSHRDGLPDPPPRVRLDSGCSLSITGVSAQDAGSYFCQADTDPPAKMGMLLHVMTLSPVTPEVDPLTVGFLVLECSMSMTPWCESDSLRWFHEDSALRDGGNWTMSQRGCVSHLNVTLRRDDHRKFTCRFFEQQEVKMEADYTLPGRNYNKAIILICRVGVSCCLLVAMTTLVISLRKRRAVAAVEQYELSARD